MIQPLSFDRFEGQHALKHTLDTAIRASLNTGRRMSHVLLTGPAGCGKTSMANLLAQRLDQKIALLTRPVNRDELADIIDELDTGVLFLDEVHEMPPSTQTALLPLLAEQYYPTRWGNASYPNLVVIAGTTNKEKLRKPLTERFGLQPAYVPYTADELSSITAQMCVRVGLHCAGDELIDGIADACLGVPRWCEHLVDRARDLRDTSQPVTLDSVLAAAQIERDGFTLDHLNYLKVLRTMGTAGLDSLSKRLRLHPDLIQDLERVFWERDLIRADSRGRRLTAAGRARIDTRAVAA